MGALVSAASIVGAPTDAYAAETGSEAVQEEAAAEVESEAEVAGEEEPETEAGAAKTPTAPKDPLLTAQEKAIKTSHRLLVDLVKKFSPEEQKHFFVAYHNYNLISTAEIVRQDVKTAVTKCGENNPDMEEEITTRFKTWDDAVNPALNEARVNLDNMIIAQKYATKKEINKVFASLSETRERTDARFDKVPVTTPEACSYLLGKMDETQSNLLTLIRSTLVSFPQIEQNLIVDPDFGKEQQAAPAR